MHHQLLRIKGLFIALIALALSASLAFGAQPPATASFGLENAAAHAGKTVPVGGTDPVTPEDEEFDEEGEGTALEDEETEAAGEHCLTDPTGLSDEDLAALNHGSLVCWAAHQETPEGYANHGAWVSEWAHAGKGAADAGDETGDDAEAATAKGNGKGNGKAKGQQGRP